MRMAKATDLHRAKESCAGLSIEKKRRCMKGQQAVGRRAGFSEWTGEQISERRVGLQLLVRVKQWRHL